MWWIKVSILAVAVAGCCSAQLQSVDIRVSGLDCASCAESIEKRLKRVRGVESASLDSASGTVHISLAAENSVKLDSIRDALKGLGYTPGDAVVVLVGSVTGDRVSLPHQQDAFVLDKAAASADRVRIKGTVATGTQKLTAQSVSNHP
jgi:copper chaperone CopZ